MTRDEALKKMQAVKSYMTSGNPIWSVTEIGEAFDMAIEALEQPTAQQWIPCSNCARNADNGGLYSDGRTRCPIQEHYALPKDGYCHLAEPWEGEEHDS